MIRLFQKYLSPQVTTINCCLPPLSFKFSLSDTSFYISFKLLRALFLSRMLAEFSLTCIFHHVWEKKLNLCYSHSEKMHWISAFLLSVHFPLRTPWRIFLKSVSRNSRRGGENYELLYQNSIGKYEDDLEH